jgi:hypothetical protein
MRYVDLGLLALCLSAGLSSISLGLVGCCTPGKLSYYHRGVQRFARICTLVRDGARRFFFVCTNGTFFVGEEMSFLGCFLVFSLGFFCWEEASQRSVA